MPSLPTKSESLPPDYFCPNLEAECDGKGADLIEIREPITDDAGVEIGTLVFMACSKCGFRWGNET